MKKLREPVGRPLSAEAKRWQAKLIREYSIEDEAGRLILQTAFEAFDRMRQAQQAVETDGATTRDRFGQVKAHPLLVVERDSRSAFLAGLRALHLDVEPIGDIGRPVGT